MPVKALTSQQSLISKLTTAALAILIGATSAGGCWGESNVEITPDLVYGHKDGMALTMDHYAPKDKPNGATLLFMVSGGWVSQWAPPEHSLPLFQRFVDEGYHVFAIRHGSSPRYVVPEVIEDVRKGLDYVNDNAAKLGIDRTRIGVFGFSAGGHLSLMLGTTTNQSSDNPKAARVAAVASVFPPSDLKPYINDDTLREQFPALKFDPSKVVDCSPLYHATKDDAPTLFIHGDKDDLVPLFHSEKMRDALQQVEVPTELIVIEGAGHSFDVQAQKIAFDAISRWFKTHLAPKE